MAENGVAMQLINGSRIVIVGGGPAGSFTALHLLRLAREMHLDLAVTILEVRDFNRPGPGGCNRCAGILSSTLVQNLKMLGLSLPPEVIQAELNTYVLHLSGRELPIRQPDPSQRIFSVYRGSGPRWGDPPFPHSFDGWLLHQAQLQGATVQRAQVRAISPGHRPIVATAHENLQADLVVLATGVNARAPLDPAWGYRPPHTEMMAQNEIPLPGGLSNNRVHIFFDYPPGLVFGALIPKGRYANISLLGHKLPATAINDFLEGQGLFSLFPGRVPLLCSCRPRVAVSPARGYYADRLVVVGDAAVTRLYKDGIGAAFQTAAAAARTAIQQGVSRQDFAAGYRPVCRRITLDNFYGRLLFRLWAVTRRSPILLDTCRQMILAEADLPPAAQSYTRIVWSMFTGDETYQRVFWLLFRHPAFHSLWQSLVKTWEA
ncbi:MAG: hypothetical protein HS126_31855 [Anaerolineales bacterium]|nr:hypothetical protein [Anaerolineales bacterium]